MEIWWFFNFIVLTRTIKLGQCVIYILICKRMKRMHLQYKESCLFVQKCILIMSCVNMLLAVVAVIELLSIPVELEEGKRTPHGIKQIGLEIG